MGSHTALPNDSKNHTGQVKWCEYSGRRKECQYQNKEDVISPTVAIALVMQTSTMDANEVHKVATEEIPGVFVQIDMDQIAYMRLNGPVFEV